MFFSLNEAPIIMRVPDCGDRFRVYAQYHAWTNRIVEIKL